MDVPDETYRQYHDENRLAVDWDRVKQVVRTGEPIPGFFTLPWWQTEARDIFLYGVDYNKKRLAELRKLPRVTTRPRTWRPAVLYPGVADEWTSLAVGVMTQAGHVGCLAGDICNAGLGTLVQDLAASGKSFAVPLHILPWDVAVMVPDGKDLSAFDYPWVGEDPERYKKPARLNRSHIMGLLLLKHGLTTHWRSLAEQVAVYGNESGVSVRQPVRLSGGSRVMVSLRDDEAEAAMVRASSIVGFELYPRPRGLIDKSRAKEIGRIDALVTRYPESSVPVCEYARKNRIPIYRPDEFIGSLAEAALRP